MKLKSIVVASAVCLLGLGTSSALASAGSKSNSRADMQQLQARSSQIEGTLNHNEGSILAAKPYLGSDWTKRITISGQLNVDGKWRTKNGPLSNGGASDNNSNPSLFHGKYYTDVNLNNSQIDLDAYVNSWTQAHLSLTGRDPMQIDKRYHSDIADEAPVNFDEAYITIGDLDKYPVYGTFGRQYVTFGVYDRHPIEPTLTQYLSQTQATAAKLGVAWPMGVYGSAYTFRGQSSRFTSTGRDHYVVNNFGAELGIRNHDTVQGVPLGYQLSLGWIRNIADADWIANVVSMGDSRSVTAGGGAGHVDVGGLSIDGELSSGPFALRVNYIQSLNQFRTAKLSDSNVNGILARLNNAQPWAVGVAGDYSFDAMGRNNTFSLSYQQSGDSSAFGIPVRRYTASYTVGVLKDTNVSFMFIEDQNYPSSKRIGSTADYASEAALRLSVDF